MMTAASPLAVTATDLELPDHAELIQWLPPYARLRVRGPVRGDGAYELLRAPLLRLRLRGCREVVLDLAEVECLEQKAATLLARTMDDYRATGGAVFVVDPIVPVADALADALLDEALRGVRRLMTDEAPVTGSTHPSAAGGGSENSARVLHLHPAVEARPQPTTRPRRKLVHAVSTAAHAVRRSTRTRRSADCDV